MSVANSRTVEAPRSCRRPMAAALRASGYPDADDLIKESFVEPVEAQTVARLFEDRAQSA